MRMKRTANHLFTVVQRKGEPLKAFVQRFSKEKLEITDYSEPIAVEAFRKGLTPDSGLYDSLTKKTPPTMALALERANKYIRLDEDRRQDGRERGREPRRISASVTTQHGKRAGKSEPREAVTRTRDHAVNGSGINPFERYSLNVSPDTLVKHLQNETYVKWPRKMVSDPRGRDSSRFCAFHNEVGHSTEECRFLRWEVESLIKRGYLTEFMPRTDNRVEGSERKRRRSEHQYSDRRREDHEEEENAEAVVNYIHGGFASGGESMTARKKHVKLAVAAIGASSSRYTDIPDITFTKQDAEGLHFPHDDAIVVKLTIARFLVKRILVDTGSSVDVIFLAALRQMKFDENKVEKVIINLVGFNGEPSTVVGKVQMPITAKGVTINSTLMVVDGDSAYNVILGRPWLSEMRAVVSTYHQVVKFPNGKKVETLRSEQAAARICYVEATKGKTHPTK